MENVKDRVGKVLIEVKKGIGDDLNSPHLVSDGIIDSLDIMYLIMKLENEFGIEIDPEDVLSENFESVESIAALVDKCRS